MVISVHRDEFPDNLAPEIGQRLQVRQANGQVIIVTVTDIEDEQVKLDANHPLAGRDLTFDIQLVDIEAPQGQ
jgi:FKBP-type peptidyl-prolyl cis-trans isomerase 2